MVMVVAPQIALTHPAVACMALIMMEHARSAVHTRASVTAAAIQMAMAAQFVALTQGLAPMVQNQTLTDALFV